MRDINTGGNVYGGIHVHDQQQYLSYEQCSDEQLMLEGVRLRENVTHLRNGRWIKLGIVAPLSAAAIVLGLWLINSVDPVFIGLISTGAAVATLYFSWAAWANPRPQEKNYAQALGQVRQIQQLRENPPKKRRRL